MITFSSIQATDFRHVALRILIHKAVSDILQHHKNHWSSSLWSLILFMDVFSAI